MSSLSEELAARIAEAILAHRLTPATKLGERELGEILGASRIVVRQALIRLAEDGLVTIERNRGAFVASPSFRDAIEVYEALILIEQGMVGQLCDGIAAPLGLDRLTDNIARQRLATDSGDHAQADRIGTEFHSELISLSNNRILCDMHDQLNRRARLLQSLYPRDFDRCRLCDDHERLAQMIEKRQARKARDLIHDHYRAVLRSFRIDEAPAAAFPLEEAFALEAA
jgi:DNA-binding GntR family transcriptional regulator